MLAARPFNRTLIAALVLVASVCRAGTAGSAAAPPPDSRSELSAQNPALVTPGICQGTTTPAPPPVLFAPAVPQPLSTDDLVGFNIQNTGKTASESRYITFGHVFVAGQVLPSNALAASINGALTPVQLDALATWPDGSVKMAALSLKLPGICANAQISALLSKSKAAVSTIPVDLMRAKPSLKVTMNFTAGSYVGTHEIDLGAALQTALKSKPDYWLQGPLVTQARVDVPVPDGKTSATSTLHLTADVSLFADGSAMADVQFNNDLTTVLPKAGTINPQPPLGPLAYTAMVNFQGNAVTQTIAKQYQYTNWHLLVSSAPSAPLNVQHDMAYLQRTGAVLPYDLETGVNNSLLDRYEKNIIRQPNFGSPLSTNGVTTWMPTSGGRPDIGFTTQYNTVWLLTQDARAAQVALAQSDTSGAIPWNYKLANGSCLTPKEHPDVWPDGRGGPHGYTSGIANTAGGTVWGQDSSHQPNLNYVPYLMSGARWNLDRLSAQASANLIGSWPTDRCKTPSCNTLLNGNDQLRGQAWGFRELKQAAFIGPSNSPLHKYYAQAVSENWAYLGTLRKHLDAKQGEARGWIPGAYGSPGVIAEWQQDFLTGVAVMSALMGDKDAKQFLAWQKPWLSGRFTGAGMNPRDGCNYNLKVIAADGTYLNTWAAIESATIAAGQSNGSTWKTSDGYYCALARSALYGALTQLPGDQQLQEALTWLEGARAPQTDQASFRNDPTFNIGKYFAK